MAIFDATNGSLPLKSIETFKFYKDYVEHYCEEKLETTLYLVVKDIHVTR